MGRGDSRIAAACALVGALGLACVVFGVRADRGAAARSLLAGVPTCTGSVLEGPPYLACIHPSWAVPYDVKITGTHTQLIKKLFIHDPRSGGIYSHATYTMTITYTPPGLKICPSPTPLEAIPCQSPGPAQISLYGVYVAGQRYLQPLPSGFGEISQTCSPSGTRCVLDYGDYPHQFHGLLNLVFGVTVGELTKNPKGLGPWDAGIEFAVSLYIPALAK